MCAVYALFGVVLIPISFLAIRLAHTLIHPTVFTRERTMENSMYLTFGVCWITMIVLFITLYQLELAGKRLDARLRELREILESRRPRRQPQQVTVTTEVSK
jgi:hypothetical protein